MGPKKRHKNAKLIPADESVLSLVSVETGDICTAERQPRNAPGKEHGDCVGDLAESVATVPSPVGPVLLRAEEEGASEDEGTLIGSSFEQSFISSAHLQTTVQVVKFTVGDPAPIPPHM